MPTDSLGAKILKDVPVEDVSAVSLPVEMQREIVIKAAKQERKRKVSQPTFSIEELHLPSLSRWSTLWWRTDV